MTLERARCVYLTDEWWHEERGRHLNSAQGGQEQEQAVMQDTTKGAVMQDTPKGDMMQDIHKGAVIQDTPKGAVARARGSLQCLPAHLP